jgi:hypothetical protein
MREDARRPIPLRFGDTDEGRWLTSIKAHPGRRRPHDMADDSEDQEKKGGFFRKLMKLAIFGAIAAAVVQFFKRRRGSDLDDTEWQELPPPAGG